MSPLDPAELDAFEEALDIDVVRVLCPVKPYAGPFLVIPLWNGLFVGGVGARSGIAGRGASAYELEGLA